MNIWLQQRKNKELHMYLLDDGEQWWFVAQSEKQALCMYLEDMLAMEITDPWNDDFDHNFLPTLLDEIEIEELDSQSLLSIRMDDYDSSKQETKTVQEWIEDGPGLKASTVY